MTEQRWRYDDRERTRLERRRGALTLPSRQGSDSRVIDLRDGVKRPVGRRFAPYRVPQSDRDALAATALAANQSVTQAPSVLDVDATSLRLPRSRRRRKAEPEPQWTPPVLAVEEAVADREVDPLEDVDDVGGLRHRPRVRSPRARWLAAAAAVGLVGLLAGGIGGMLREREDPAVDPQAVPVSPEEVADPALLPEDGLAEDADQDGAPVASVEGKLALTEATLHDGLAGPEAPPATSFTTSSQVTLNLGYASWEPEADDRLGVIWFSGDTEVGRSDVELTDGTASTSVTAPPLPQAGPHRADVTLNDEVIASLPFEVVAP